MWEALKQKINAELGYGITVAELEKLQLEEVEMLQQMGIPFPEAQTNTVWWKLKSGALGLADQAVMIDQSLSRIRGSGVLAVPQEASEFDILMADPVRRALLETAQVGAVIGGKGAMGDLLRRVIQALGGGVTGTAVARVLHSTTRGLTQFTAQNYSRLPGPVQTLLTSAGITSATIEGLSIDWEGFFDWMNPFDDDEEPANEAEVQALIASWGQGGAMVPTMDGLPAFGLGIVKTWTAGHFKDGRPIRFFRLASGLNYAERENGTWRAFRYKHPIVLYSDGARDLRSFIRADRALDHQARQLRRALDRRAPKRQRRAIGGPTIIETGPGSVKVS